MQSVSIFWFRRDLRLFDNAGLFAALTDSLQLPVVPIFIFDKNILEKLSDKADKRVTFIHAALEQMQQHLALMSSSLEVYCGTPLEIFTQLLGKYNIKKVYTNHDYESYATERDSAVQGLLNNHDATFYTYKDQVIFEKDEVVKDDGKPYTVFTPYSKKWKSKLSAWHIKSYANDQYFHNFYKQDLQIMPSLESMGFVETESPAPFFHIPDDSLIKNYKDTRDIPSIAGTTKASVHLRFGTISIRELVRKYKDVSETYLNELIWREFYQMILWNFPNINKGKSFKQEYDNIQWLNDESLFEKWCNGLTGYPIVDAGMRELNETGYMHNRVRMITASFLTKHLLIDWRWGEAYFANKLLDYDFAANNGGWQWAAGSGCDAAPYFRIFNPYIQTQKFDPQNIYIKKWIPEFESDDYPAPIVHHEFARNRCLETYKKGLNK